MKKGMTRICYEKRRLYLQANWIHYPGNKPTTNTLTFTLSVRPRRENASNCHQRYNNLGGRKGEHQSFPRRPEEFEDAKSGSFATRRPFCLCFVRAGVLGESSVTPKSSSGDHERESWIGIPLFNIRRFNYLIEMKKKE